MKITHSLSAFGLVLALLSPLSGKSLLPADPIALDSLQTFKSPSENWVLASNIGGDPRRSKELTGVPGTGVLVNVAPNKSGDHLTSTWEHGDIELSFEFLMPQESNSGIYLMGRYELQLLDSWGVEEPGVHDCGAIYERWITEKKEGYEGTAPLVNATRAPGLWQTMRILFQAPRFDKKGKKTANARFLEVEHNGFIIHGPIAFRNITKRPFDLTTEVTLQDVKSKVSRRKNAAVTKDDEEAPTEDLPSAAAANIDPGALSESTHFTVTYTGQINIPNLGTYAFDADSSGTVNLAVAGQAVLVPINPGV
ncbi:MAG: 3-keto-disaccharide hydrolase, partial [Verrucomicrobiia bacterium]